MNPGRAGVVIDGKYVGPAVNFGFSRKYAVAPGEHEIKLEEPRYEEMVTEATIQAGKTTTLSQTMKPLAPAKPPFGRLRTIAPPDKFTAVYVNNRFMGHTGEFNKLGMPFTQVDPKRPLPVRKEKPRTQDVVVTWVKGIPVFNNSVQGLLLNPATYSVKFVPANGAESKEQQVTIEADKTTIVKM